MPAKHKSRRTAKAPAKSSKAKSKKRARASWKGQLRFGLVSIEVEAVNARNSDTGDIHFHQLHEKCHSRIHYEKVCPVHGAIENDEIVSGYEYTKGKYVEIEPEELDALRSEKERALTVDDFIDPDTFDPIYFDGRMYYLIPADADAAAAYAVFSAALTKQARWGIGHMVMSGRDQVVVVRPIEGGLQMAMLNFASEIRELADLKTPTLAKAAPHQVKMAETLIKSWSKTRFDFSGYEDRYRNRVAELIDEKVAGKETVEPEPKDTDDGEPDVINLMDALKRSLAKNRKTTTKTRRKAPPKRA